MHYNYNMNKKDIKIKLSKHALLPGILREKTMDDKLINIPNDNKQNFHSLAKISG